MDFPESSLIGSDGFCSQEIINLITGGYAASNTFNEDIHLGQVTLKGIKNQQTVGFLSMLEYQNQFVVGSYYKNPSFPIWIVHTRHHYSVVFSISKTALLEKQEKIDLLYSDCFSNHPQEIYLTLTLERSSERKFPFMIDDLSDVLKCIYTRWNFEDCKIIKKEKEAFDDRQKMWTCT